MGFLAAMQCKKTRVLVSMMGKKNAFVYMNCIILVCMFVIITKENEWYVMKGGKKNKNKLSVLGSFRIKKWCARARHQPINGDWTVGTVLGSAYILLPFFWQNYWTYYCNMDLNFYLLLLINTILINIIFDKKMLVKNKWWKSRVIQFKRIFVSFFLFFFFSMCHL